MPLPEKYHDHKLAGNYKGYRECHIAPDWLLIYKTDRAKLILVLTRTGNHSELF
ncbi:MAG: type II toxin-antitoxin system YafQ family toxin [Schwartzia sp.]|nr:type II toxin-antitoxin system YafQ family toxin [Schwartzia sp. (in: firmicutes)]